MILTDICIHHTKKSRNGGRDESFVMHPFEVSVGPNAGKYEVLRNIEVSGGTRVNRSIHVTQKQLAELFATGLMDELELRLRVKPGNGSYPTAPPVKRITQRCIEPGSAFSRLVADIPQGAKPSGELAVALTRLFPNA
jgi:hypothetical protein